MVNVTRTNNSKGDYGTTDYLYLQRNINNAGWVTLATYPVPPAPISESVIRTVTIGHTSLGSSFSEAHNASYRIYGITQYATIDEPPLIYLTN